jgi:hypothetical protein
MKSFADTTPFNSDSEKPFILRIGPDILAFGTGLFLAYYLKWETTDLVWSLWLGSLVLGYLTLLSALAGGAYIGITALNHDDFKKEYRTVALFIGIGAGLFFLGFFSLHFCGFHAGHSVFLTQFFPVEGMPDEGFGFAFMNPFLLWLGVFKYLMLPYGLFLIPAIIAERKHVFKPLLSAVESVRNEKMSDRNSGNIKHKIVSRNDFLGDAMKRPYVNVVRMHLLIFFFAFAYFLKIESFIVFTVVYFVYFFPWKEFKKLKNRKPG